MIYALYIFIILAAFYLGYYIGHEEMKFYADDYIASEIVKRQNKPAPELPPKPNQNTYERSTISYEYTFIDQLGNERQHRIFPN